MSADDYRRALESAAREYDQLSDERRRIDARLSELAQSIGTLTRLCGFTPTVPWGLTDACRTVLRNAGQPQSVAQLRDRLSAVGVDLSGYANTLAALHTTLKRLAAAGELETSKDAAGRAQYRWLRAPDTSRLSVQNARIAWAVERSQARRKGRG